MDGNLQIQYLAYVDNYDEMVKNLDSKNILQN